MATRMSAEDRRVVVLEAATRAFARTGYHGTSTDAVAKEAGVSQPYVVRLFGSKRDLFLEVLAGSCIRIRDAFEAEIARAPFDPANEDDWGRLGETYTELLRDRDLLMVLMHGFSAGNDEHIARCSREGMATIAATVFATGCTQERARDFFSYGMLLNVMVSMRAPEHLDEQPDLTPLTECAFGDTLSLVS